MRFIERKHRPAIKAAIDRKIAGASGSLKYWYKINPNVGAVPPKRVAPKL